MAGLTWLDWIMLDWTILDNAGLAILDRIGLV